MEGLKLDGVLWITGKTWVYEPLCPIHHLPLKMIFNGDDTCRTECPEDGERYDFSRRWNEEISYIAGRVRAKDLKKIKYINLDDEAVPIAEDKAKSEDEKFFVTARIMESKVGQRLVIYAGERGRAEKTQIFVEPEIKRLSFDQKDLNPADVFLKVEAEFADGTKHLIEKKGRMTF
jgi:hypothetical protein